MYKQITKRSLDECYRLQIINFFSMAADLRGLLMVYTYYPHCAFYKNHNGSNNVFPAVSDCGLLVIKNKLR